ncbi:MAG: hypothetical protein WCU74_04575 [Candidatus Omnitrophota bacterium]
MLPALALITNKSFRAILECFIALLLGIRHSVGAGVSALALRRIARRADRTAIRILLAAFIAFFQTVTAPRPEAAAGGNRHDFTPRSVECSVLRLAVHNTLALIVVAGHH